MQPSPKTHRGIRLYAPIAIILLLLISQEYSISRSESPRDIIYKTGTKFILTVRWWGLYTEGALEITESMELRGRNVMFAKAQLTEMGGFLGFIAKFLRIYKGANTFESYIDSDTFMPVQYEVYKLKKDGAKEIIDYVYFDREQNRIVSLQDNKAIVNNVAPDIRDIISAFLDFLHRLNEEELFPGKTFKLNIYGQKKTFEIKVKTTYQPLSNGEYVYGLEVEELPEIFEYPAHLTSEVTETSEGVRLPARGKCDLSLRFLPDITVQAELNRVR